MVDIVISGHNVRIAFDENSIHIYNAFQIKEDLKSRGYRFDAAKKTWYVNPTDVEKELDALNSGLSGIETLAKPPVRSLLKENGETELPESYSVIQLRNTIERALNTSIPAKIWIRGVIASEIKSYKWFSYFDLKDEDENLEIHFNVEARSSNIEKVIGKLKKSGVTELLEKELPVFILASLKVSLKNKVDVRMEMLDIMPEYTRSKIKGKLDITIEKLKKEKIFELQKGLSLPKLIKNIALITSEQGTSIKDIMAGIHPNEKRFNIFFTDSRMEGGNAVSSVVRSIEFFENHPSLKFDCIIIARGGGSEQSLSVFNEYEICKRVCIAKTPVVTAIGHEKDLTAIELCSHFTPTPSTPSGIGKFFSHGFNLNSDILGELLGRITLGFSIIYRGETEKINSYLSHIPVILKTITRSSKERLAERIRQIEDHVFYLLKQSTSKIKFVSDLFLNKSRDHINSEKDRVKIINRGIKDRVRTRSSFENTILKRSISRIDLSGRKREIRVLFENIINKYRELTNTGSRVIVSEETKVKMFKDYVESNDPQRILERGFSLTLDENNKPLTSIELFKESDQKKIRFFDGEIFVEEKEIK